MPSNKHSDSLIHSSGFSGALPGYKPLSSKIHSVSEHADSKSSKTNMPPLPSERIKMASSRSWTIFGLIAILFVLVIFSVHTYRRAIRTNSTNNGAQTVEKLIQELVRNKQENEISVDQHKYQNLVMSNETVQKTMNFPNKNTTYQPTWPSLDSRPLPAWFDDSKVGIFIHWGIFSVPGFVGAWFWDYWKGGNKEVSQFMKQNYKPNITYQAFASQFTAEFFEPKQWAKLFQKSGAKYVVLTSKHHEGYSLWPSRYNFGWNAKDIGPNRDLVGDLAAAVRSTNLKFGVYHSLYEWFNPLYLHDRNNKFTTNEFVQFKMLPEMYELVNTYKPEIIWSDGDWEAYDTYWQSKEFLAWLYNQSPVKNTVVVNDRWGLGIPCHHGGYFSCNDRYNPKVLQPHKWENAMTLDKNAWANRRNAQIEDYLTPEQLMITIVESVSCGGNILVNVGPTKEGVIPPIQEQLLLQMGQWLEINGEAIYGSVPYKAQNDTVTPGVWYTQSNDGSRIYAMITKWPGSQVNLGVIDGTVPVLAIKMLGYNQTLHWAKAEKKGIVVNLPHRDEVTSNWVWTLVLLL